MLSIAKIFRLWRQYVSGKHFEGYRAQRQATQVIKLWSRYKMNQFRARIQIMPGVEDGVSAIFETQRTKYNIVLCRCEIQYAGAVLFIMG